MFNVAITLFVVAILAAIIGLGGLAGSFIGLAKLLATLFVFLFLASLVFNMATGRKPHPPLF